MSKQKYVAGIDAGTTGTTVMIVDLQGRVVDTAYREYPCSYPHPGWVAQDMGHMWGQIYLERFHCDFIKGLDAQEWLHALN